MKLNFSISSLSQIAMRLPLMSLSRRLEITCQRNWTRQTDAGLGDTGNNLEVRVTQVYSLRSENHPPASFPGILATMLNPGPIPLAIGELLSNESHCLQERTKSPRITPQWSPSISKLHHCVLSPNPLSSSSLLHMNWQQRIWRKCLTQKRRKKQLK